jgi:Fur family transcriptional regulator, ferric uptake regulator
MATGQSSVDVDPERLARLGLRSTRQRLRILGELAREPHDVTAQELHRRLVAGGERVGLATVYRTLGALAARGAIDALAHHPGEVCYRLCSGMEHHHHLVCTDCHRVVELEGCNVEDWVDRAAGAEDFVATAHRLEVLGVCADCRAA